MTQMNNRQTNYQKLIKSYWKLFSKIFLISFKNVVPEDFSGSYKRRKKLEIPMK